MHNSILSRQFLLFLCTGGFAATVNFTSRILYNLAFGFSTSIILAYITGMTTAFVLAKIFVFKDSKKANYHSFALFTLVNIFAIMQTWGVSLLLAYCIFPNLGMKVFTLEIAHGIGVIVPVFTSFLAHKKWSFG